MTSDHFFEPFFTTKEVGKGTGLGLAMVYGIVKQSGGHIRVRSAVGAGTTFEIFMPAWSDEGERPGEQGSAGELPRGTETVLLVEDEEDVRALARLLLQQSGYTVLEAASGLEALERVSCHARAIDLLITDVVMPKMGGRQLAEAVRQLNPRVRVLFISGYTDDSVMRHGVVDSGAALLQKPFTASELARKVREVLREGQ